MDLVCTFGKMEENIKEIMYMIKNKEMVNIIGQMEKYSKVHGLMEKDKVLGK
jgi:hypothetical protein